MRIEQRTITSLTPADYNPRKDLKPGDTEYEKLKASIEQFGYVEPAIFNERTGRIVGGHQRLKVMADLGITTADVVIVDLDENTEKALNVALNKISGEWDEPKLALLITDLQAADFDVNLTGFDTDEIEALLSLGTEREVTDDGFDLDAALEQATFVEEGDLWTVDEHRLLCGDATKQDDVERLMSGKLANLILTDPPYNASYKSASGLSIKNDSMEDSAFYQFLLDSFTNMAAVCEPGASAYIFHADTEGLNFRKAFKEAGFYLSGCCIWVKNSLVLGRSPYQWSHEPILYGWKTGGKHRWFADRKQTTVWRFDKPSKNSEHPTSKPLDLMGYPITNSTPVNAIVLDTFAGSGSTLMAAAQLNRVCYAMELDPKYASVILRRYAETYGPEGIVSERGKKKIPYSELVKEKYPMKETTRQLKLGSLFDGSGGFPLAGSHCGIHSVWASEIEPFPILVTTTRFPDMKHLGDVSKINGGNVEPVDIVTFGSPCQDLSIAGRRGGLDGERSGLFFHAVRIIQEMREATNGRYPRFAVWENVPGAFSSNKGADFHAVLQTLIAITDETAAANLPRADKWEQAGVVVGDGWSIAWRVLDAQFFGVPQRRKRIFLIADFASERAGHILFEPTCLPRDPEAGSQTRQDAPTTTPSGAGNPSQQLSSVFAVRERGGKPGGGKGLLVQDNLSGTLACANDQVIIQPLLFDHHPQDSRVTGPREVASTVTARYGTGGGNTPIVVNAYGFNAIHMDRPKPSGRYGYETEVAKTLDTSGISPTCNQGGIAVMETYSATQGSFTQILENVSPTLCARDYKAPPAVTTRSVVRKLTPTECARLQGFPDNWTHDLQVTNPSREQLEWWWRVFATWAVTRGLKKTKTRTQVATWLANPVSDTALYKMWGNGIALPCAQLVLSRIAAEVTNNR